MIFTWERLRSTDSKSEIWENYFGETQRAKVFGGWLVRSIILKEGVDEEWSDAQLAMTFVPDPEHKWTIDD